MAKGQFVKNGLKQGIKVALGALGPVLNSHPSPARILTYHSVGHRRYEMNVTPEAFAAQMAWLASNQKIISLESAATGGAGVALTFDDGYRDNLINALPILEHYGFPATIFVVSGCLGATLPREKEPDSGRLLSAEELREAASRGLAIGGHTRQHPRLATLSPEHQMEEIAGCKADLEAILEFPIRTFAYPYGSALDYDVESVAAVRRAGFELAFSNRYGPVHVDDGPFAFRRIWIDSTDTLKSFEDKVSGRLDALRLQDSALGIRARRLLNAWMGTR